MEYGVIRTDDELSHHGILGQKWGVRRYQNADGTLTAEGRKRRNSSELSTPKEEVKKAVKTTAKMAVGTAAALKTNEAAMVAGVRLANDLALGKVGYPVVKALETAAGAAEAGRIASNVSHMAAMLAGKSALGETAVSAVATVKGAAFGASAVSNIMGTYGNAKLLSSGLITAGNIAAGAGIVGLALTGVAAGVTVYKVGKAVKTAYDNRKKDSGN